MTNLLLSLLFLKLQIFTLNKITILPICLPVHTVKILLQFSLCTYTLVRFALGKRGDDFVLQWVSVHIG